MRHALRSAPSAPCRVEKPYIITTFKSLRLLFSWTVFLWLLFLQLHDPLSGIPFVILGILTVTNCGDYYFSLTSHACCLSCSSPSSREAWTGGTPPLAPTISSSSWIPCFISVARCESWGRISILQTFYPQKQPNTSDQVTVMLAVWSWCKISVHRERFSFIRLQVIQQFGGRCSSKFWLLHVNGTKPNPAAPRGRNWEATTSNTHILYIFHGTGLYLVSLPLFPAFPFTCTLTHKYMQSKMTCRLWAVRRRITWSSSWGYETNLTGAGWESDSMGRGGGGRGRGSQLKTEGLRRLTVLSLRHPQTTSISSLFSSFLWTTANRQGNRYIITPS